MTLKLRFGATDGVAVGVRVVDRENDGDAAIDRDILDEIVVEADRLDEPVSDGVADGIKIVEAKK